jgi:cytochrome c biogenesis protein CcdA
VVSSLVVAWYAWLSQLVQGPVLVIRELTDAIGWPVASALLFGLIGATSPCQLTTSLGALAFSASRPGRAAALRATLTFVGAKVAIYSMVGGAVVVLGLELQAASIPVVVVARRLLGPLMLLVGLALMGVIRLPVPGALGRKLSARLSSRAASGGRGSAFLLGVAFSFAFCPTLFLLFFGLTLPLALRSAAGWSFPGLFAVGTTLPLVVASGAIALGLGAGDRLAGKVGRWHRPIKVVAGAVFLVAGFHDTVVYWWL